ncbi:MULTISPECIES: MMPL family transporter [Kaistia]|uniref:MMPL family transporter n=1 Tax=Kaistia TaxID=166953 RepID=UPI003396E4CB
MITSTSFSLVSASAEPASSAVMTAAAAIFLNIMVSLFLLTAVLTLAGRIRWPRRDRSRARRPPRGRHADEPCWR